MNSITEESGNQSPKTLVSQRTKVNRSIGSPSSHRHGRKIKHENDLRREVCQKYALRFSCLHDSKNYKLVFSFSEYSFFYPPYLTLIQNNRKIDWYNKCYRCDKTSSRLKNKTERDDSLSLRALQFEHFATFKSVFGLRF